MLSKIEEKPSQNIEGMLSKIARKLGRAGQICTAVLELFLGEPQEPSPMGSPPLIESEEGPKPPELEPQGRPAPTGSSSPPDPPTPLEKLLDRFLRPLTPLPPVPDFIFKPPFVPGRQGPT